MHWFGVLQHFSSLFLQKIGTTFYHLPWVIHKYEEHHKNLELYRHRLRLDIFPMSMYKDNIAVLSPICFLFIALKLQLAIE